MKLKIKKLKSEELTLRQRKNLSFLQHLTRLPVFAAELSDAVEITGACRILTGEIFISPRRLGDLRQALETLVHELAHAKTLEEHYTGRYRRAYDSIARELAERFRKGEFDERLKEVV